LTIQIKNFKAILLNVIDESLMILGESGRATIYLYVEEKVSLKKEEIPQRLQDFASAIQGIFGSGAPIIDGLILKRLCEKLNVNHESVKGKEFQAAIGEVMKRSGLK